MFFRHFNDCDRHGHGEFGRGRFFGRHSAGHLGYAGTSLWIDFERQLAIVLLTNRTWPHRQSQDIRAIRPAFHDSVVEKTEQGRD